MNLLNLDKTNWFPYVKEILNEIEMTEIWNKQCITHWKLKPSVVSYMKTSL